jgi:uncharacterized protein
MLGRIVTIVVLVGVVFLLFRLALRKKRSSTPPPTPPEMPPPPALVACAQCGIHLPPDDATWRDGKAFCSKDHAGL